MKHILKAGVACIGLLLLFIFSSAQSTTGQWTIVGPVKFPVNDGGPNGQINGIGRVSQMKFSATNANRAYAVSASGGLWISNDAGLNWSKTGTDNQLPQGSCASVCVDYTNENIIYLSTGDANYYGNVAGIYKSTNGGVNWSPSNASIGNRMALEILMDPTNPNTLIAATTDGIWKSLDAGASWTVKKAGGAFREAVYKPGSSTTLYAVDDARFWRSTDNGDTWTQISSVNPSPGNGGRLAVTPANANVVYAGFVGSNNASGQGGIIYQSTDGGTTFTQRKGNVQPNLNGYDGAGSGQGSYNWALGADRVNANVLYVVGHCVWKSTNGGANFTKLTDWPFKCHTDMHQIFTSPYNNNRLFNINDGGIFVSTDGGTNWTTSCDGLSATEFYHSATSNLTKDIIGGGTQDNGEVYFATNTWHTNRGGDWGSRYAFDYANANRVYYIENGNRKELLTGVETSAGITGANNNDRYALTKQNTNLAFAAQGTTLRRTTNLLAATPSWAAIKTFGAPIKAVTVSPANTNEVYVVLNNQQVHFSSNATAAGATFTQVSTTPNATNGLANIAVSNANSSVVYVTCNSKVYRSVNKAVSWTDITGIIPNTNIICLVHDPSSTNESFYLATAFGVYYRNNTFTNWQSFSSGLPTIAQITDVTGYFDGTANSLLRLSFYGRGVWQTPLYPGGGTGTGCTTAFEPNETQAAAKTIAAGVANAAAITTAADVDYFKVVTTTTGNITFDLNGPAGLDYDLYIYNSAGTQIGAGESAVAIEKVVLTNQPADSYSIRVIGYAGAFSTTCYTIKATVANAAITATDKKIINRASGKALDDLGYNTADAAAIGQWTYAANVNQLWQFVDVGAGYYKIQNKYSGKVLDNLGFSTADGTGIVQYGYVGGENQKWQVVDLGAGYYKIINKFSGKLLDNPGSSTADGTQVIQYADNGGGFNQQWQISDATAGVPGIPSQPLSNRLTADASTAVKIVPNPVINSTTIIVNAKRTIMAIMQVVDAGGAVVLFRNQQLTSGINRIELNTTELSAGTYYVMVKMNESVITKKMVVVK
jgi:photosystem II stability/assembly factor-like uncharacterized protein